jgi:hypothetical protein
MITEAPDVHDRDSAIQFVQWCVAQIGLGYHPDTRFADYVEADGKPVFSADESKRLDDLTEKACGFIDPAEVGLIEFQKLLGENGATAKR